MIVNLFLITKYSEAPCVGPCLCESRQEDAATAAVHFSFIHKVLLGNQALFVSAGLLGLAWHLAHHKDLLQSFLDILIHLTLRAQSTDLVSGKKLNSTD